MLLIRPKPRDLGEGFMVRRALPALERRTVGPFIFLDEMGPVAFEPGQGLDVRPHPHIGLSTVTYLFEGAIEHRDTLGSIQVIRPGDVNLMVAGRGIAHSERSPLPRDGGRLHGIQFWMALPIPLEEAEPAFLHYPAPSLPRWTQAGVGFGLLIGSAFGRESPVRADHPTVYLDLELTAGASLDLPAAPAEKALYVIQGAVTLDGDRIEAGTLAVLADGAGERLAAAEPARAILFGGAPLDGPRRLWWNFVSSRAERVEAAKADWAAQRFGTVPGETEWIPLPER